MNNLNWYKGINYDIFYFINGLGFEEMDIIMTLISNKFIWIPLYLFLIFLIYNKEKNNFFWSLFMISLLIFCADSGSVYFFKNQFEILRPCHTPNVMEIMRNLNNCGGQYGFISSHASNSFAITFFISLVLKNRKVFFWLINWAILIGLSRIYLGVHFPFDIIGGMIWGLVVSLLIYKLYLIKKNATI